MKKGNLILFQVLHVIAWIIFVGLSIDAAGLWVNFVVSLYEPELVARLYQKLDLSDIYVQNKLAYFGMYSFLLSIAMLKVSMFYALVQLSAKLNLESPFNTYVARKISKISYYTLSIGIISLIATQTTKGLMHRGFEVDRFSHFWGDSQAYILMAAVIYVIAAIFSRGVELQNENELTI